MTNKPASLLKRIVAAVIDMIMIVTIVQFIIMLITQTPLGKAYNEAYNEYMTLYSSYAISLGLGEYVLSNSTSVLSIISGYTSSQVEMFNSLTQADSHFMEVYKNASNYYFYINVSAIFVTEFVLLGLVPYFTKYNQTCGKIIMRLGCIDIKYDMPMNKKNKIFRFLGSFMVETFAVLLLFKDSSLSAVIFMSPLIVLAIIMFSNQKQALHDVLGNCKVVDLKEATIFGSKEEKEAYDAEYILNHQEELNFEPKDNKKPKKEEKVVEEEIEEVIDDEDDPFMKEEEKPLELLKTSVFINKYPSDKVKDIVFAIQDVTDLNVVDAKRLLDKLPCLVKTNLELDEANEIKEKLENLGVEVEVR